MLTMKKLFATMIFASLTAGVFALPNLIKKEQYGANALSNLDFILTSEDLIIKETYDTTSIEVEIYCNYKKYIPEVSVSDSTLYIESARNGISFFPDPTGFKCSVIVYVPQKKDFDTISIKSTSANVNIERPLSAKKEISITATSGDITSEKGIFSDAIKVSLTSGDINLFNLDTDDLKVSSTSGDIKIRKFTGETGSIHSTSGKINLDDFASEYANFKCTSGDISVKKLDCDYFDANSTSGEITVEMKNPPTASSKISCTSGDIELYLPMRAKFTVEVSSNSGTFRDKFNNNRMTPRDNYRMDYNGGGATIQLKTTSGAITLDY